MSRKLDGKVAIVTGASKGIGAEIAIRLADEGAAVVVNYATARAGAERVVGAIVQKGGRAVAVQADLSLPDQVRRLFDEATRSFNRLDILINNAGVYEFLPLEQVTPEHFHRLFDLNVLGLILASQEAARRFGPEGGAIVNVSSLAALSPPATAPVYSATKAAVDAVTRSMARELGPRKIRVNSVNPGLIETEGVKSAGFDQGDFRDSVEKQTPLGRIGQPGDIAPVAVFLAGPDAAWITGEALLVAGGMR